MGEDKPTPVFETTPAHTDHSEIILITERGTAVGQCETTLTVTDSTAILPSSKVSKDP